MFLLGHSFSVCKVLSRKSIGITICSLKSKHALRIEGVLL